MWSGTDIMKTVKTMNSLLVNSFAHFCLIYLKIELTLI